jgi:hypothetical protein
MTEKRKGGQKSTFNAEDAATICAGLSEGRSLLSIVQAMGLPYSTAKQWERDHPEHAANVARAREAGCHALADEALKIADTPQLGVVRTVKPDGSVEERQEDMTSHRKLQIDTRKWLLSRWLPKVYGDKLALGGAEDLPAIKGMPDDALQAKIAALTAKVNGKQS